MAADENRTGIADPGGQRLGLLGDDLEMFGRQPIDERHRVFETLGDDDGAEIAPACAGYVTARQGRELARQALFDGIGEPGAVGHEDRLRRRIMFGLGQEVGGDPVGIGRRIGEHQHFRRAGDHVDADRAEDAALGGRHIGVAGPDDLGDRGDGLGAIGERRDRLRAADAVNLVDAGETGPRRGRAD